MKRMAGECEVCGAPVKVSLMWMAKVKGNEASLGDDVGVYSPTRISRELCPVCAGKVQSFIDRMCGIRD